MDPDCCNSPDVKNLFTKNDDRPERIGDWLILGFTLSLIIPFLVANFVIFLHRKRKYFQASGWDLLLGSSVTGLIWIASALVVNQHFKRDRIAFFSYCALWTFWFELTLGICGWLALVALRLHCTYIFATKKEKPNPVYIWLVYFPLMLAPAIIFSIVATVLNVSHHPCHTHKQRCVVSSTGWKLSTFLVLPPVYFSFIIIVLLRVRKHSDSLLMTHYQQAKESATMAFVLYLLTGTTYWTNRQNNVEGRCFLTFCVCSLVFIRFWVDTGWPVYLCVFRRGDAMDKYEEELRRRGATCLQHRPQYVSSSDIITESGMMSESFTLDGQEAIVQAVADVQAENQDLKIKRESLHRRISQVKAQIEELKKPLVPISHSFVAGRDAEKVLPDSGLHVTRHLSLELRSSPRNAWLWARPCEHWFGTSLPSLTGPDVLKLAPTSVGIGRSTELEKVPLDIKNRSMVRGEVAHANCQ